MNKNQVNDTPEEARDEAGEASGSDSADTDPGKNGSIRKDNATFRSRFASLARLLGRTM